MEPRIDLAKAAPGGVHSLLALSKYVHDSGLENSLLQLVFMRASQLNGCAYCIDMHSKDARAAGETEQRLYELDAWRETPFFTDRERAALAWTEAITNIQQGHAPEAVFQEARRFFNEKELANLTFAIATINSWNRLAIGLRAVPGTYQPAKATSA
jgi:AhpD family alkylhydroperoxidase